MGSRGHAVYYSPVQIIAIPVYILLVLLSYELVPSAFSQQPSFFMFCYIIVLFGPAVLLAWVIVKAYPHVKKRFRKSQ